MMYDMSIAKIKSGLRRYPATFLRSLGHTVAAPLPKPRTKVIKHSFWQDHSIWEGHDFAAAWLGHATVLIRLGGLTVLTDPVWSERIGMKLGGQVFGPERLLAFPASINNIPHVDLVLLTHAHFDHLDRPTLRKLVSPDTTVITAWSTSTLIPRGYAGVRELRWNSGTSIGDVHITALPVDHWGARKVWDRHRGCNAYLLEHKKKRILFAGDTAKTDSFNRLGKIDLAIMGIGAYEPWVDAHATPEQVWEMAQKMPARRLMPIHHSTFELSDEPINEPMQRLLRVGDRKRIVGRSIGELVTAA